MLKHLYQRFLQANPGVQHYACHSHHYWPDVTRDAMIQYWDDSAQYVDDKWNFFFQEKVPKLQQYIATLLGTNQAAQIVFAPNTHEFVFRLLSCLDLAKPVTIVTTDSEFHSFTRQINRLDELSNVKVVRVKTEPFADFDARLVDAVLQHQPDMVFFSQVFFNSGMAIKDLDGIINRIKLLDNMIVVDGYHAFTALPLDLSQHRSRIFYLSGGYKYAQGGEGVCFMHCPKSILLRPLYTGWYAEFGELQKFKSRKVDYSKTGFHYAGSTMDYSGIYRQLAVFEQWHELGISIADIHGHVQTMQASFLGHLDSIGHAILNRDKLVANDLSVHGHFLSFELPGGQAGQLHEFLKQHKIMTDHRGNRLRFGFAPYHEAGDIDLSCLGQFNV